MDRRVTAALETPARERADGANVPLVRSEGSPTAGPLPAAGRSWRHSMGSLPRSMLVFGEK
jgi:hypothetical protein